MSFWRSKITEDFVKKATEGYIKACTIPVISNARFEEPDLVQSTWCQKSPDISKKRQFSKIYSISNPKNSSNPIRSEPSESISAKAENLQVAISKTKNWKNDDVCILEVFSDENIVKTINLTEADVHGPVYFDDELGGIVINPSKTKVAYIAEVKKAKNTPFFPVKSSNKNDGKNNETEYGKEFAYNEEWGEQLIGKSSSAVVVVDLETNLVDVMHDMVAENLCPGQLQWISDDVICGIIVETKPYRLGLIYCTNRPSGLFKLDIKENDFKVLKEPVGVSCKRPRVSPSGKAMIWLETDLQEGLYPGPHEQCFRMMHYDLEKNSEKVVIDMKDKFDPEKDDFAGFYLIGQKVPQTVFVNDNLVLWNAIVDGNLIPMTIHLKDGSYKMLDANHTILDIQKENIIAVENSPIKAQRLKFASLDLNELKLNWQNLSNPVELELPNDVIARKLLHDPKDDSGLKFSSIYIGPESRSSPLIVWPHGGPHSIIPWAFSNDVYYFLQQGFSCLMINYRGSIAQGQSGVLSLPGKVGDQDVKDCYQAVQDCLTTFPKLNKDQLVLFGGSHGGFLVTHLIGQYPDAFKACIARNPVTNIATMSSVSDIGDWTFNEAGLGFNYLSAKPEEMKTMYEKSPINFVGNVKAPVYLMIGKDDLRVPPSQGIEYYHNLKALGKDVDMNYYEDNHPLGKLQNHSNVFINSVLFFKSILGVCDEK